MLEEERALLQLLREEPGSVPTWAWDRVQARLHEPPIPRERLSLWLWWNRRLLANIRWTATATVVALAMWTWLHQPRSTPPQSVESLLGYVQAISYAQSTVVDDPLNENTQIILSGWGN